MQILSYMSGVFRITFKTWERGDVVGNIVNALTIAAGFIWASLGFISPLEPHIKGSIEMISGIAFVFLLFVVGPYRLWSEENKRANLSEEKLKPKLKCSFGANIPGCVRPNTDLITQIRNSDGSITAHTIRGTYYRIVVEAVGVGFVPQCSARIPWIKRNGRDWVDGENLIMPFVPAEHPNCDKKDVVGGAPEFIDMLFIAESNSILITTKGFVIPTSINYQEMLSHNGEYLFHLDISSPASAPVSHEIKLIWRGDWRTAQVIDA